MRTLVLDTSTNLLYISFIEDEKIIYEVKTMGLTNIGKLPTAIFLTS